MGHRKNCAVDGRLGVLMRLPHLRGIEMLKDVCRELFGENDLSSRVVFVESFSCMSGGQQRLLLFDARHPCTTTAPPAEPRFPKNVEIENEGASQLNVSRWSPPSVDTCVDVSACLFKFNAIAVHVLVVPESKSSQPAGSFVCLLMLDKE